MTIVARVQEVVIDCAEPGMLARFWGELLDAPWGEVSADWAVVRATPVMLAFQKVPEAKSSPKNRLHLDIQVAELEAAAIRAQALGARRQGLPFIDDDASGFIVMTDPESNEFCFVIDPDGTWQATLDAALTSQPTL